MSKFFIYLFIIFFTITGSIIIFSQNKKEPIIEDKNIKAVNLKEINNSKYISPQITKEIKEQKEKITKEKKSEIENLNNDIEKVIAQTDALIEKHNLVIPEDYKHKIINKQKTKELQQKVERIKKEINELKNN